MAHKVFIFVPAFGQMITATTFLTTHALQQHFASKSIAGGISTLSFPDIAELRSMAMTIWYDTMPDSDYFLQIDADMGFDPTMVTDMIMFNEPIVGTIYPQRKIPISWAGSGTGQPMTERRGNFMLVEGVGMGCTLIRRDVVTKMLEQMPELVDTRLQLHPAGETIKQAGSNRIIRAFEKLDLPDRGLVSEDLSFCIRWNRCGGQVWAAIGYHISHVGAFDYRGRYLDIVEQQEAAAMVAAQAGVQAGQFGAVVQPGLVQPGLSVNMGGSTIATPLQIIPTAVQVSIDPPAAENVAAPAPEKSAVKKRRGPRRPPGKKPRKVNSRHKVVGQFECGEQ